MVFEKKELKKKSESLSDWYTDVVLKAEMADYGPVRGTMVIRPYGFAIWEIVQEVFNSMIKKAGVQNAYFPLFIPYSLLEKEKDHVEGFSPELAVVTIGGGERLKEPLVVRPTSETIMYEMYSRWIHSWRDLPILINQWNNVVRWEKRTYLFLRTLEFLWQEGHTAHASESEAREMALKALGWYKSIYEKYYAIPAVVGVKSEKEKFAGAITTYSIEALMPDGKALQAATSHELGQNFARVFNIVYQNKEGKNEYVWQTSWGLSTRSLGGLFLTHGDDDGLILPPRIAPIQVVIVPIVADSNGVVEYCQKLCTNLGEGGIRAQIDRRDGVTAGRKFNDWEVKGVPIRVEVGDKELRSANVTLVRRDSGEETVVSFDLLLSEVQRLLEEIQEGLYRRALKYLHENTTDVDSYAEFRKIMSGRRGFIRAYWCGDPRCEDQIKEETKATVRVRTLDQREPKGKCVYCGKDAKNVWYFAQSY